MPLNHDAILDYLKQRDGDAGSLLPPDATYGLMRAILADRNFGDIDALARFCQDSENLRPWLLNELDRRALADRLTKVLHDMFFAEIRAAKRTVSMLSDHPWGWPGSEPTSTFDGLGLPLPQLQPTRFRLRLM